MSTRCHVVVIDTDNKKHYIYHHCDGYPEGVGSELTYILGNCSKYDWETICEKILEDSSYEEDDSIHGDEEYIYHILADNDSAILRCFSSDGSTLKNLIFEERYPNIKVGRGDLRDKYNSLKYSTSEEKLAFLDAVYWVENYPTKEIIKKVLSEALNTTPDLSSDIDSWVEYIYKKFNKK